MKITVCSDLHLDWVTAGVPRFDEIDRALHSVVDHAIAWKADMVLFLGDLCDPDSGPIVFRCVESLMRAACRCKASRIAFVAVAGNHDCDGSGTTTLAPLHALEADGRRDRMCDPIGISSSMERGEIVVADCPCRIDFPAYRILGDGREELPVRMCFLPYVSGGYDPREVIAACGGFSLCSGAPLVVAGHMTEIPGATYGEEQWEMARGRGIPFPLREVAELRRGCESPTVMLNGHVHRRQRCSVPEAPGFEVLVPGSLARLTFGAGERIEPGWLDVEF